MNNAIVSFPGQSGTTQNDWQSVKMGDLIRVQSGENTFDAMVTTLHGQQLPYQLSSRLPTSVFEPARPPPRTTHKPSRLPRPKFHASLKPEYSQEVGIANKAKEIPTEETPFHKEKAVAISTEEDPKPITQYLLDSGILEAYGALLTTLSERDPPEEEGIFEFAAREIEKYGASWRSVKG